MLLTRQIRIEPSEEQEQVLWVLSERCRLLYNFALAERKKAFDEGKKLTYIDQQNKLPEIRKQYPEYKWVYSKVLQMVLKTLDANYKSFFSLWKKGDKAAKLPGFKGKHHFNTMIFNQSGFSARKGKIVLSHKHNAVKLSFEIPRKFSFAKVKQTAVYQKDKQYWLSVTYEYKTPEYIDNERYFAIDLGITNIVSAVNDEGRFLQVKNKRPDKYWEKPVSELQGRRDHCKKFSKKWKTLNARLKFCIKKGTNQLKDFQHKLSHKLINGVKANTIIVGDLSIKEMCKKNKYLKALHKSLHNTGTLSRFTQFLTYKAKKVGKKVIEIGERGTSKTCSACGNQKEMPLYQRVYSCQCGNSIDRDKNSAILIMSRFLSQNGLWTAYRQFVGNLRQTCLYTGLRHSQEVAPDSISA